MSDTTTDTTADGRAAASRTPEEIEAEIERTRESLAEDIDVLQERLSPASLLQAAKEKFVGLFLRPDGSVDPIRTGVAVGVTVVLVAYFARRRGV